MRFTPRTNTIILWVVSIGLMVGMVITFTPTLGALGGGGGPESQPSLFVNGEPVTQMEVNRARQSPLFAAVQEGPVAEDLELLLVDSLVRQEVLRQAASDERVGGGDVRQAVDDFREQNGVAGSGNDEAYRRLINNAGFTDADFRDYMRQQLRMEQYQASLSEGVEVSEAEVETFYLANRQQYATEPRIAARQLVVEDQETAEALRRRALAGEAFADLARENSLERAEQGGAIGGETPEPVGRAALPSAVAEVAFGLPGPGITDVVESAGRFWLVSVEAIVPAETQPLEAVRDEVREDALEAKRDAAVQQRIEELRADAEVTFPEDAELAYEDPVVATVGGVEIHASDLARATYTNPQIQQSLSAETASLILQFFKPTILEQLVERELALQGASELDATFFGTDAQVARSARAFVARDAEAGEEEIQAFYEENQDRYVVPASADVLRVDFDGADAAEAYRDEVLGGTDPAQAAEAAGVDLQDLGTVQEGELDEPLDSALFASDGFEPVGDTALEASDVLVIEEEAEGAEADEAPEEWEAPAEDGADADPAAGEGPQAEEDGAADAAVEETFVVLLAARTEERVRPLEEVRSQVEQAVLDQERTEMQEAWLSDLREEIEVENRLAEVQPEVEGGGAPATPLEGPNDEAQDGAEQDAPAEGDAAEGDAAPEDGETEGGLDDGVELDTPALDEAAPEDGVDEELPGN